MALKPLISSGGGFFKPVEHTGAVAILVEPKKFEANRPIPGQNDSADTIFADITVFPNEAAFTGQPIVMKAVGFSQKALVSDARGYMDEAFAATVSQGAPKGGKSGAWLWKPLDPATQSKVAAYMERRDGEVAEAKASAPSFD